MPVCRRGIDDLIGELRDKIASLQNSHLQRLMDNFFTDADFLQRYSTAPAAKSMHHVYLGGLLEHSLAVANLAEDVCRRYPDLNRDLLLCGALLHDIGKVSRTLLTCAPSIIPTREN